MNKLKDKTVLITGGANGIGLSTALKFAEAGCRVIITDIDKEAISKAVEQLEKTGAQIESYTVDVGNKAEVDKMATGIIDKFGKLDILINNAGVGINKELIDTSRSEWEKIISVNLWGVINCTYAFLPLMVKNRSGQIVNVSSGQHFLRMPTWGAYTTTKMAIAGFTEILHYEVKKFNVHVTTIFPYLVKTKFYNGMEGETWAGRLLMKYLLFFAHTPKTAARKIFKATKRRKLHDMGNLGNVLAHYFRFIPFYARLHGILIARLLTKKAKQN